MSVFPENVKAKTSKPILLLYGFMALLFLCFAVACIAYGGMKALREAPDLWDGMVWGFFTLAALGSVSLYQRLQKASSLVAGIVLFLVALLPRVLFALVAPCQPVSDFANYAQMAVDVRAGNPAAIAAVVEHYQLPEFAGLAVLNALLSFVFTPTALGWQLAGAVLTSFLVVTVFCLGSLLDKRAGLLSAFLYAWYPGNLLGAQLLTNQHGATLFTLLAVLALVKAIRSTTWQSAFGHSFLTAALLAVAHFFHPSSLPTRLAMACFLLGLILQARKNRKQALRLACALICLGVGFQFITGAATAALRTAKLIPAQLKPSTMLSKIVVGLNPETLGAYSLEDYTRINETPTEERTALCLQLITERVTQPLPLAKTLAVKTFNMWVRTDNLFVLYDAGVAKSAEAGAAGTETALRVSNAFQLPDVAFAMLIYLGACLGVCSLRKKGESPVVTLLVWLVLGWLGTHMLSEVQPRYRYYAMPELAILCGLGLTWLHGLYGQKRKTKQAVSALEK